MAAITARADLGGAPGTAVGLITGRRGADGGQANCLQTPITEADMTLAVEAAGDIQYVVEQAPAVTLAASSSVDPGGTVDLAATVSDENGTADLNQASVVVADAHGRIVSSWSLGDFIAMDENTLTLQVADHRLTGPAPWTATVSAVDSIGNAAAESAVIER